METTRVNDPINLESVEQQFNNWRASRSNKRERIPRELWQAAVRLCDVHPVHQVSRSLRLSYTALKELHSGTQPVKEKSLQFMQLEVGSSRPVQWQMECIRADGSRLRLTATGAPPSAGELLKGFWS